jgi:3-deoxy-D-manno-octulosonic-acid transferase
MTYLLNVLYLVALLVLSPWLVYKALTTGKYRRGFWSKLLGQAFPRSGNKPCVWFHGVSVGEIHLLRPIVSCFRERHPDWDWVLSTTTDTGFEEARNRFPDLPVCYWPWDFTWAVRRALRRVRPNLVVLAEGELWPNFLAAARERGVAVAVVNGRMSPRSFRRYQRFGRLIRPLLAAIDLFAVQTEEYAALFRALGADPARVHVTDSVKYDGVTTDRQNPRTEGLRHLFGVQAGDLVWIAGSTQGPEEEIVLDIFRRARMIYPNLRLFLVPRQKERFDEVASLLQRCGESFRRRSTLMTPVDDRRAVILVDTIGELGALWGLADVAFVGGSLDGRRGGQNMIEPAAYGAAVVFGPHVWNFRETAARLTSAGAALQIADAAELEAVVLRLLGEAEGRQRLGQAARELVQRQQGATQRTIDRLDRLLTTRNNSALAA